MYEYTDPFIYQLHNSHIELPPIKNSFLEELQENPHVFSLVCGVLMFVAGVSMKIADYPDRHSFFSYNPDIFHDKLWFNGAGLVIYTMFDTVHSQMKAG